MKTTFLILALFAAFSLKAQTPGDVPPPPPPPDPGTVKDAQIFTIVEQMPTFPGGDAAMLKFLRMNIRYPDNARECGCQGTIFVSFVVDEEGTVQDPKILRGVNCGSDITYYDKNGKVLPASKKDEAASVIDCGAAGKDMANETIRVVKLMPQWVPGKQNSKQVKVQYNLPVKFTLR